MRDTWSTSAPTWSDSCAADPEPDEDDNGPWCRIPVRAWSAGPTAAETRTTTNITPAGSYL